MAIKSPSELRDLQTRINAATRRDQAIIGAKPATLAEISRAPVRSPKQGALAKRRNAK